MSSGEKLRFAAFTLDPKAQLLFGPDGLVNLTPKALAVLDTLVGRRGALVSKIDLLDAVWPDVVVGDAVLKVCVAEIRKALGDDSRNPRFIETLHRRGYRFIHRVIEESRAEISRGGENATPHPSTLVGQEPLLGRLRELARAAESGQTQVVLVSGALGQGKTALLTSFSHELVEEGSFLLTLGQCVEQAGEGEP